MIESGELPQQLQILLSHPNILKVGRLVNADLRYLEAACHPQSPFTGTVDLAKYAKERLVISSAKCSLADLCASILGKRLNKNVPERVSQTWENDTLTPSQLAYAACDAYASLRIYEKLSEIEIPRPLPRNPTPSMAVLIYSSDNTTLIAQGEISSHMCDQVFDGINITQTRIVVDVLRVFVPGAKLNIHQKRPLLSFGDPPFSVVCLRSHLRVFTPSPWLSPLSDGQYAEKNQINTLDISLGSRNSGGLDLDDSDETFSLNHEIESSAALDTENGPSIGDIVTGNSNSANLPQISSNNSPSDIDEASVALGEEIMGPPPNASDWDGTIRSCVLKDVFHIFNMFKLSSTHGLRIDFARRLSDALFIPEAEDRNRINAWGSIQSPPLTFEQLKLSRPAWLWRRCRRIIPPPKILYPLVEKVFRTYGPLKDATTGLPLFNAAHWKTAKNVLDLIHNGFVSDVPGIALYTQIAVDRKAGGLPIYRCARGTNFTEGGVHTHLRSHLPSSGASIRHVHACLLDFVLRHNLLVRHLL